MFKFFFASILCCSTTLSAQKILMSYNVRNAKGMDNKTDYDRVAAVIKEAKADIIALQELDSFTKRSDSTYVLKVLAEKAGYEYVFAPAISFQGGKYGVGILSEQKPLHAYSVPLPGKEEQRVLLIAEFKKYVIMCTHLSLTAADRNASVSIINEQAAKFSKPIYLLGDLNAEPASPTIAALKEKWKLLSGEQFTFPAGQPDRCIDYIFSMNNHAKLKYAKVVNEAMASDHRPILIKLK